MIGPLWDEVKGVEAPMRPKAHHRDSLPWTGRVCEAVVWESGIGTPVANVANVADVLV